MASLVSLLNNQPHPPTPPKDFDNDKFVDEAIRSLDSHFSSPSTRSQSDAGIQTGARPNTPPPSSPLQSTSPKTRRKQTKRLRFSSSEPTVCGEPVSGHQTDRAPPSCSAPVQLAHPATSKSILKPSDHIPSSAPPALSSTSSTFPPPTTFGSISAMLPSVVAALEVSDLQTRRDAYSTLTNCLRAYKDFPDAESLRDKLSTLEQYIERDSSLPAPAAKVPEQALQCAFILIGRLPRDVSVRFRSAMVEACIAHLEGRTSHKEVVKHQLHLLTLDELYGKPMNADRAKRVLKGVADVDKWLKGQSMLVLRLMIYRQVVRHHPNIFLDDVQTYLPHVYHGLLSVHEDIRLRALETAMSIGTILGQRHRLTRAVEILMDTKSDDDVAYSAHIENILTQMLEQPDDCEHVPLIWGTVMVMLRGNHALLERWLCLKNKRWLKILQICFNKSDEVLNNAAWKAWQYTIYAAGTLFVDNADIARRLVQPVHGHLSRLSGSRALHPSKQAAYSTLHLLWYNAFGQPRSEDKTRACWDRLVHDVCRKIMEKNPSESRDLSERLCLLLNGPGLKVWNAERALDSKTSVPREEIPRLDSLWIRRNCSSILNTFKLFDLSMADGSKAASPNIMTGLWKALMGAVVQAGEKEVKTSTDVKKVVVAVLTTLYGTFTRAAAVPQVRREASYRDLCSIIHTVIDAVGVDTLADTTIRANGNNDFQLPSTPSNSSLLQPGSLETSVVFLFRLCTMVSSGTGNVSTVKDSTIFAFQKLLELRGGLWACISVLCACAGHIPANGDTQTGPATSVIWQVAAELAIAATDRSESASRRDGGGSLGYRYGNLVKLVCQGLKYYDAPARDIVSRLYQKMSILAKQDVGDGGYLLAIAAPCTRDCSQNQALPTESVLHFASILLAEGLPVPDENSLAHAGRVLGDRFIAEAIDGPMEWFQNLCDLLRNGLQRCYNDVEALDDAVVTAFFRSLILLLGQLSQLQPKLGSSCSLLLSEVQTGLLVWIADAASKTKNMMDRDNDIEGLVQKVWSLHLKLMRLLRMQDKHQSVFEACFAAGFRSPFKTIVNETITLWNTISEEDCPRMYSRLLAELISQLQPYIEVKLPEEWRLNLLKSSNHSTMPTNRDHELFPWLNASNNSQTECLSKTRALEPVSPYKPSAYAHSRRLIAQPPAVRRATPKKTVPLRVGRATPPKLRHDDSQVRFVAVTSSPIQQDTFDSQLMTDHQKEARERQKRDAAIFTDLRSSSPIRPWAQQGNASLVRQAPRAVLVGCDGADDILPTTSSPARSLSSGKKSECSAHDAGIAPHERPEDLPSSPSTILDAAEPTQIATNALVSKPLQEKNPNATGHSSFTNSANGRLLDELSSSSSENAISEPSKQDEQALASSDGEAESTKQIAKANIGQDEFENADLTSDVFHDAISSHLGQAQATSLTHSSTPLTASAAPKSPKVSPNKSISHREAADVRATADARASRIVDSFKHPRTDEKDLVPSSIVAESTDVIDASPWLRSAPANDAPRPESPVDETTIIPYAEEAQEPMLLAAKESKADENPSSVESERDGVTKEAEHSLNHSDHVKDAKLDLDQEDIRGDSGIPADADDCIMVQEPNEHTPSLRELLYARGVVSSRLPSASPSVQSSQSVSKSSRKRKSSVMVGSIADSQQKQEDTPSRGRDTQAKRRRSNRQVPIARDEKPSEAIQPRGKPRTSGGRPSSTLSKPSASSRNADAINEQSNGTTAEVEQSISERSPGVESQSSVPGTSQERRSRRRRVDADHVEAELELPARKRRRRQDVAVVVDLPSQQLSWEQRSRDTSLARNERDIDAEEQQLAKDEPSPSQQGSTFIARLKAMIQAARNLILPHDAEETASNLAFELQREIASAGRRARS